jgi:hypothetical protein
MSEETINCIICGNKTEPLFNGLVQCTDCGHLTDYTSSGNASEYCEDKRKNINDYKKPLENDFKRMSERWKLVKRHCNGSKRLLDYGCADNVFIDNAPPNNGFKELIGFDTNWLTGRSDERVLDQPYDAMTLWHSMEHLPFPRMVVDRVEHEYLFIVLPWAEYLTMDRIPSWWIFNHGKHLQFYTRKSLFMVLHDYEVLEENYVDGEFLNAEKDIVGFALRHK